MNHQSLLAILKIIMKEGETDSIDFGEFCVGTINDPSLAHLPPRWSVWASFDNIAEGEQSFDSFEDALAHAATLPLVKSFLGLNS